MEALSKSKIKLIRSLKMKKNRDKEGLFIVEGRKIVEEFISLYPNKIEFIAGSVDETVSERQYKLEVGQMKELTSFKTPSNLLAVVKKPEFDSKNSGKRIALDGIQDPGNLGTIIRTADWFGIKEIICSKETVDCFNPKVIQASMGSIFRVNVIYTDLIEVLETESKNVFVATMEGENYQTVNFPENSIIVLGNEGNGISENTLNLESTKITIPRIGEAESLNVAMACGVLLAEITK